jgi:hypothetical protein
MKLECLKLSVDLQTAFASTQDKTNKKQGISNQLWSFVMKLECLNISVDLQTAFASETCLTEGQWLAKQLNMLQLCIFRGRNRNATLGLVNVPQFRENVF